MLVGPLRRPTPTTTPTLSLTLTLTLTLIRTRSDHFEGFLANKYPTAKRFGLEGCEVLIVGMKEMIDTATENGVDSIVMGMPHRSMVKMAVLAEPRLATRGS